jgi:hypothetical protein
MTPARTHDPRPKESPMTRLLTHVRNNVVAYLALFVALGGTSYAALSIPAGSVGTQQLRNGAVTSRKLAKGAVTARSLDPKSIAGHIADWAQIRADGHVAASSPGASVTSSDPAQGLYQLYWHRAIPQNCVAIANPVNVGPINASATANTAGPFGRGRSAHILVSTFDAAGNNVPENVNVLIICP